MQLPDYIRLHAENRFRAHPARWPLFALAGSCTVINWGLAAIQKLLFSRKIQNQELVAPPVFIIGHWRSGTTLMHELMALDNQHAYPCNYDAFVPHHMLVSRWFVYPIINLLLPSRRPMDNMKLGAGAPQEDDFALCGMGAPTPYRRMAYPNRIGKDHLLLNINRCSEDQLRELRQALETFYKTLTVQYGKRLVLKSPPHTGRIEKLAEWFPGAKFIHLARDPKRLVPSTMHLWQSLDQAQGFQLANYDQVWLKNYIFECQDLMYEAYFEQAPNLAENQLVEVQFEDLTSNPEMEISRVYQKLELDGLEELLPKVRENFASRKKHKKNHLPLDPHLEIEINQHWQMYRERFGYAQKSSHRSSA